MAEVRGYEEDDYNPEYGLLVLRDPEGGLATGDDGDEEPTGTFAGAGNGWLTAHVSSGYHLVRLELHDCPPPDDTGDFADVLETPYRAGSGGLELTTLTSGAGGDPDFELDGPGDYRVRVARGRGDAEDEDRWLLRFWRSEPTDAPRWLARSRPAVGPGDTGWRGELQYQPMELADIVCGVQHQIGAAVTADQVGEWAREHMRSAGWMDEPLWPPPREPLTTGHADLDRSKAAQHAEVVARAAVRQRRLDEIAAELGVPPARRRRDALPLLAAAGILEREGPDRYRGGRPARVDTVLSLPPKRARSVRLQDARHRYGDLAEDLAAVLRWTHRLPLETTATGLAARLLVTEAELREALAFAKRGGVLHGDDEPLRLWPGTRTEPPAATPAPTESAPAAPAPPAPAPAPPAPAASAPPASAPRRVGVPVGDVRQGAMVRVTANRMAGHSLSGWTREPEQREPAPPVGAPPRAGALTANGTLVVWRDGVRENLARLDTVGRGCRALQTAHGVLVCSFGRPATLVAADGGLTTLDDVPGASVALLDQGRRVVVIDAEHHRRESRYRLRVIDLAGGPEQTMPWPEHISLLGVHDDTVFLSDARGATLRWTPGSEPVRQPTAINQIDPLTGTGLARHREGVLVIRPDGTEVMVPVDLTARLAPGATRLWTVRSHPPAMTLFSVQPGPEVRTQVHWLPAGDRRPAAHGPFREPLWEDTGHVLFAPNPYTFPTGPPSGVRLAVRDGSVHRLPADTDDDGRIAVFVEPMLTAER